LDHQAIQLVCPYVHHVQLVNMAVPLVHRHVSTAR